MISKEQIENALCTVVDPNTGKDFVSSKSLRAVRIEEGAEGNVVVLSVELAYPARSQQVFLTQLLRDAMPWGQQMPEPLFDDCFYLLHWKVLAEKHLKLCLAYDAQGSQQMDAIWFNADMARWSSLCSRAQLNVAYRLGVNHFRGEQSLQLMVETLQ